MLDSAKLHARGKQSLCGIMYLELDFPKTVSERRKRHQILLVLGCGSNIGKMDLQKCQRRLFPIYMSSLYCEEKGELDWISMKLLKREEQ
jgi:hypothetical protein